MSAVSPALNERKEGKQKGQKQAGPVGSMRLLIRFMAGQRSVFTMAGLMLIFAAATAVLAPLLVAYVINYLSVRLTQIDGKAVAPPLSPMAMLGLPDLVNPDFDTIAIVTIGIIVLTMINSLGDSLAEIYLARGGRRLGYNLRVGLYSHLQRLSLAFHDQRRTGDILTRVTSDVAALEDFIISSLSDITGSILLIGFILIAMLRYQWQVAVVAAIIIPVMALVSNYFTTRIKSASKKLRASEGELASAAQEMLTSIRVIQTYGLGSYEQEMFADQSQKAMDSALEAAGLQARFSWVVSVMGAFSTAAVIWVAVYLIFRDPLLGGIGLLTAFIKYIQDMFKPTKRIIQEWNTLAKLYASLERIADLLDRKPAVQDLPGAVDAPPFKGHIEFRNVSFAYAPNPASQKSGKNEPPRLALKGLSFEVGVGQVLAIVGHTGAGKSTIVQLLPRLYDPSDGQILFDGHDIREFKLDSLRAQMSMVLQETILFSGSVVENVAYGRTDATWGEIIAAAKQANAHEFIERMPERYYTLLGERGANLSGGQRQRIAIARAFIRNTPILILDEPSTGLDAESTELVLNALRVLMKGKTTIIISHDLNLIRSADTIVVIKQGEVEQIGNHESLLEAGGLYANLYMKQYGYKDQKQALQAEAIYSGREMLAETGKEMIMETSVEDLFADLARSPSMLSKLPALATAFDPEIMKQTLQRVLFGKDNNTSSSYYIETCTPGKAIYLPENVCNMQYSLKVKDPNSGELFKTIVNARLFPDAMACENFWRESLTPLSAKVRGRPEVEPFVTTSAVLEDLNMTISVYPIDGLLPTLLDATDRERMKNLFSETLPEVLSGSFELENVKPEVVHYGRYRRCVLRYTLEGKEPESGEPMHLTLFGKVDSDSYGALSIPVITSLLGLMQSNRDIYRFNIPHSLGFHPDLKLLLLEALPTGVTVTDLLEARLCGEPVIEEGAPTLEESIVACARIAATIHRSNIKLGRLRNYNKDVELLQEEIKVMQNVLPGLGGEVNAWLEEVMALAQNSTPMPLCFSHGDFTYSQLIITGSLSGLVDFDSVCQAEPALDLGQFLAYQHMVICKTQRPDAPMQPEEIDRLSELFIGTYIEAAGSWLKDPELLRARVIVYETLSMIRLVVHSWEKLKGTRLKYTVQMVKERMSCLAQVS